MPHAAASYGGHGRTFFPYWRAGAIGTLLLVVNDLEEHPMFIFSRPLLAPLLALAAVASLVVLDTLIDLRALF
jgi:hypothetical protein